MTSEPAWKKVGLSLKRAAEEPVTKEKKDDQKRAKRDKKDKKSKAVRKQESVESHWTYCSTFVNDREAWKFSKQQQNWLVKHIHLIPDDKEEVVFQYLETIQGGAKQRLIEDARRVINTWNEDYDLQEEQRAKEHAEEEENEDKKEKKPEVKPKEKRKSVKESIGADYALKARNLYKRLEGEKIKLSGIDETQLIEEDVEVENYVE